MLLGLALAPLADQRQDDDNDAEVGLHVPLQQNLPMSQKTIATLPPSTASSSSMPKPDNGSVDAAAKKVFSPHPLFRLVTLRFCPGSPSHGQKQKRGGSAGQGVA
jgi:hypothetical protein